MVYGSAHGVDTACTDAWVATLARETGHITGTVVVNYALGVSAGSCSVAHPALAVARTWTWIAWIWFCK